MMCVELPARLVLGRERGRAADAGRRAAQQRQKAEIALEDIHRQNSIVFPASLLAAPQASCYPSLAQMWLLGLTGNKFYMVRLFFDEHKTATDLCSILHCYRLTCTF